MGASRDFLTFFRPTPGDQTPRPIFTQNGPNDVESRIDDTFAVKSLLFITLISRPPKRSKFCKKFLKKIFVRFGFNLHVQRENISYFSSEPNESGIVNRQSGGEKLKYVLKFYIRGTHHVISRRRSDDSALCLWVRNVWGGISRKPLEIQTWV